MAERLNDANVYDAQRATRRTNVCYDPERESQEKQTNKTEPVTHPQIKSINPRKPQFYNERECVKEGKKVD